MNYRQERPNRRSATLEQVRSLLRPEEWESDISRNALDDRPFDNLPPPSKSEAEILAGASRHLARGEIESIDLAELIRNDPWPIPRPEDREGYCPNFDGAYWLTGLRDHLRVMGVVNKYGLSVERYLDFGCASGRILRHFCSLTDIPELWGSDINYRHIRWLQEHLPARVKPLFNHCIPCLPLRDGHLDLVTAFSVFTHIDTFETAWLAELRRVLRPGGIAYLTVHNEDTWRMLGNARDSRIVKAMASACPDVGTILDGELAEGRTVFRYEVQGPYRAMVFHSNSYLKNVWGRFFDILDIIPGHHAMQTVLVARSPG